MRHESKKEVSKEMRTVINREIGKKRKQEISKEMRTEIRGERKQEINKEIKSKIKSVISKKRIKKEKKERTKDIREDISNDIRKDISNDIRKEVRNELIQLVDPKYQLFSSRLLPGVHNILGVRLPYLRKIAKRIVREDWKGYLQEEAHENTRVTVSQTTSIDPLGKEGSFVPYFEEIMLEGMVIGYVKENIDSIFSYTKQFIPKIDNWSICDSFCSGLKVAGEYPDQMWNFIQPYIRSDKEYSIRFGVVMILFYYVDEEHMQQAFALFDMIHHEGYYARMAVAWAISIFYINYPVQTLNYLRNNRLDEFTYQKALQKITESRAVSKEWKRLIRDMRANKRSDKNENA